MQTFMPHSDFILGAQVLDNKRLNNQLNEAYVIYQTITGQSNGWLFHPAVLMWMGYPECLAYYALAIADELDTRKINNGIKTFFRSLQINVDEAIIRPSGLRYELLLSHRAALVYKNPVHYSQYYPDVEAKMDYFWPVQSKNKHLAFADETLQKIYMERWINYPVNSTFARIFLGNTK